MVVDVDQFNAYIVERADEALYQAKSDGRNCVRVALPDVALPPRPPE